MNYILVDTGYLFFYRYHATKLWYKRAHDYTDDLTMAQDINYQNTFQKKVVDCIQDKIKKHDSHWDRVVFCRDTRRQNIWRNQLANDYKAQRDTSALTGLAIAANLLKHTIFTLCRTKNAKSIGVRSAEADDIVYITKQSLHIADPNNKFIIIASDHDYYQIIDENTTLVRLDKTNPILKSTRHTHNLAIPDAQRVDLLVKIILGDKSDNISGCFKKCGPKTALNLALNPQQLLERLAKDPNAKQIFTKSS